MTCGFFCYDDSAKAAQIRSQPEVNVSFANDKQSEWTSLFGQAEVEPNGAWIPSVLY